MNSVLKLMLLIPNLVSLSHGFLNGNPLSRTTLMTQQQQASVVRPLWAKKNKKSPSETLDMKELKQRINELTNPYHELFAADHWSLEERPEDVYIILFKPDTEEQGLHSIEYPKGSGSNFVLAFQSKEACDKFAATLKAQKFDFMAPKCFDLESLESLCDTLGVFVQVVPEGMEILPPTQNVQNLGQHNPHLKEEKSHLDYLFDMFEMEVDELGLMLEEPGSWE